MRRCRSRCVLLLLAALLTLPGRHGLGQIAPHFLNSAFETNLSGWTMEGEVSLDTTKPLQGKGSLRLGSGKSAVHRRIVSAGLRILLYEATLRAVPSRVGGVLRARCYDAQGHLLLDLRQPIDPAEAGAKGGRVSLYFKTQAHTASVVFSIEKETAAPGYLYADAVTVTHGDSEGNLPSPLTDLQQEMQPVWQGKTVYDETVLLLSRGGRRATGRLLFTPTRILSVRDYAQTTTYVEGKDYTLQGKTLVVLPGSRMPTVRGAEVYGAYRWYKLDGRHVVVTYTHDDPWTGPTPTFQGDQLPHTLHKLHSHLPLTIVTQGDSITLGNDVSGFLHIPPYLPPWPELFASRLKQLSGDDAIRLYNTALGGATAAWGLENADSTVAALDPDLVIIGFGMNDVWGVPVEQFRANIQGIIHRVRARRPEAEFILIASMRYDPAYAPEAEYGSSLASYRAALQSLTGPGVRLLDMYALSSALFAAKSPKDFISNPMHPNDFLGRWYAQSLVALLDPSSAKTDSRQRHEGRRGRNAAQSAFLPLHPGHR